MGNVPPNNADFLNFPYTSIRSSSRQIRSSEQTFSPLVGTKRVMLLYSTTRNLESSLHYPTNVKAQTVLIQLQCACALCCGY